MPGLSQYPTFSEASLLRALREQGFHVSRTSDGFAVRTPDGSHVSSFHSSTFTDKSGNRYKNALRALVRDGFLPPDQWRKAKADEAKRVERIGQRFAEVMATPPPSEPVATQPPAEEPAHNYPCDLCAKERCRKCKDAPAPCSFRLPLNLGRHKTSIHGTTPKTGKKAVTKPKPRTQVTTRVAPEVITDPITRLTKELDLLRQQVQAKEAELAEELKRLRAENTDLRKFKQRVEARANDLYDELTTPDKR